MRRLFVVVAVMGFMALTHCGGSPSRPDSGADAGGETQADGDAGSEAPDAATDGGPSDSGTGDTTPDASTDSGMPDSGEDGGAPDASTDAGTEDGGAPDASTDSGVPDSGVPDSGEDGGTPDASTDAGTEDGGAPDASTDAGTEDGGSCIPDPETPVGGSRLECTFNSDCPCDERCECDESVGCQCLTGTRGTGRAGIDTCSNGNDCESSLCAEGWSGDYCSGPCESSMECGPRLPVCASIAFIGRICIRHPDGEL